ncbi:unnamed protein product [Cunninghamella blakesleeana]
MPRLSKIKRYSKARKRINEKFAKVHKDDLVIENNTTTTTTTAISKEVTKEVEEPEIQIAVTTTTTVFEPTIDHPFISIEERTIEKISTSINKLGYAVGKYRFNAETYNNNNDVNNNNNYNNILSWKAGVDIKFRKLYDGTLRTSIKGKNKV